MNLHEAWNNSFEESLDRIQISKEQIMEAIQKDSQTQLAKLKKQMKRKLQWGTGISIGFLPLFLLDYNNPEFLLIMGIIESIFVIPMLFLYLKYRKLNAEVDYTNSVLPTLKAYYTQVKHMLRFEEVTYIFLYPFAAVGGMCFSLVLKGRNLETIFSDHRILLAMLIYTAVAVPAGAIFARWWNKRCFGKHLRGLQESIYQLEQLNRTPISF